MTSPSEPAPDSAPATPRASEPPAVIHLSYLMAECSAMESSVERQPNGKNLGDIRPGGAHNPDTSVNGWLFYLTRLHRLHAEHNMVLEGQSSPNGGRWGPKDLEDLRAALAEVPVHLTMEDGTQRGVYPKSKYAIERMEHIDRVLGWLVASRAILTAMEPTPAILEMLQTSLEFQHTLEREFAWIACHPGPDVPWPDTGAWDHKSPAWTRALTPIDLLAIRASHIDCNYKRNNIIAAQTHALSREHSTSDMPADAFLGLMSSELGVSSRELSRHWSQGSIYASCCVKWKAQADAEERAEAERKKNAH